MTQSDVLATGSEMTLSRRDVLAIAAEADVDPRTVEREWVDRGRGRARERIREAFARRGLSGSAGRAA